MARTAPTLGDFSSDLIMSLGGKPTKQSTSLFNAWQAGEGGWTHNDATFNPLNLTAPGSGLPTINKVGVVALPSYQAGIDRTSKLIASGYPAIAKALRSGQVNFQDPALQADLNRWLTGQRTPGMSEYVAKIAGRMGQGGVVAVPRSSPTAAATAPAVPTPPAEPVFDEAQMGRSIMQQFLAGKGKVDLTQLPLTVNQAWTMPPAAPAAPAATATATAAALPGQGVAADVTPGGGWGGSKDIATSFKDLAGTFGLSVMSEKRDRKNTASGGVSDHWTGSKGSYAYDLSNGTKPTKEMDAAARKIMEELGVAYDGKSELVRNVIVNGYRVQVLYRTNVGGNHFNHIHVGVKRL